MSAAELINGWCRHDVPFTSCRECHPPASVTEALEDALEREPERPTRYRCPHCKREHTEQQWQCLTWLQFAGAIKSGRLLVSAEVRRCVCSLPIARECVLPMVEIL